MKKILLLISLIFYFFIPTFLQANDFAGGSGTESDPYLVANAVHLDNVRLHLDAHFLQISDISLDTLDFQEGSGWNPIGSCDEELEGEPFTGSFNGGNFEISGLFINRSDSIPSGLFGCTQNATFINMNLTDVSVSSAYWSGGLLGNNLEGNATLIDSVSVSGEFNLGNFSGGIAGQGDSLIIQNCTAEVTMTADGHAGGIIGAIADGEVRNSSVSGTLNGDETIGGAVGRLNDGYMFEVNVVMDINSEGGESGGVVGEINRSIVESCTFSGEVISGERELGGVAGIMLNGSLINCFSEGYLECLGTGGGIIGNMANGNVINSNSTMDVNSTGGGGGGIVGISNRSIIVDCIYAGTVGTEGSGVFNGGIVGFIGQDTEIINASSSGTIRGSQGIGGLVGSLSNGSSIISSNSSAEVTSNNRAGGIVGVIDGSSLDSVSFTGTVETLQNEAGGIVGVISGNNRTTTISNVENFGSVTGIDRVGGVVGWQFGLADISNARNHGNITGNAAQEGEGYEIGGIIGLFTGNSNNGFRLLINEGQVSGWDNVGGVIGRFTNNNDLITIDSIFSSGTVGEHNVVGGLIGSAIGVRISNSSSSATISSSGIEGGLFGVISNSEIEKCFFNGNFDSGASQTGGIAAVISNSKIENSYTRGLAPIGSSGIAGSADDTEIINTYSTLETNTGLNNLVSEINNSEIINSYFSLSPMSDFDPENPEGLPLEDMTYRYGTDVYVDWDFNNIWRHDFTGEINDGLPFFRSEDDEGFYFVLLGVNDDIMGEASGEGYFDEGDEVTLTAEANENFEFINWVDNQGNVLSEEETYQFVMPAENIILTAVFDESTPVRDLAGTTVKIYPNPVSEQLNIHAEQNVQEVRLYNSTGQLIHHFSVNNNTVSINTTEMPVGTYLLSIQSEGEWIHESIQVIR